MKKKNVLIRKFRLIPLGLLLVVFVLGVPTLFNSCGDTDVEMIKTSMSGKLEDLSSYFAQGEILINDPLHDKAREYKVNEWYLAPDKLKLEIYPADEGPKKGQIFVSKQGEVQIYNPLINEKIELPPPSEAAVGNKFSFLLYEKFKNLASEDFEIEAMGDQYELTQRDKNFSYEIIVSEAKKGFFGSEMVIDQIKFYSGSTDTEPDLIYSLHGVDYDLQIEEETFDLEKEQKAQKELEEDVQVKEIKDIEEEAVCYIDQTGPGGLQELEFEVLTVDHPSFEILHLGVCGDMEQASIKYTGKEGSLAFTQKVTEMTNNEEGKKDNNREFIPSDYENILKWYEDEMKYHLIGDFDKSQLIEMAENIKKLEL